jgi:hypothetical protein
VLSLLALLALMLPSRAGAESICPDRPEGTTLARRLTTGIDIDAPAQVVWQILLDFERYPEWNPFVKGISGKAAVGERLALTVQPPGGRAMGFEPTVLAADAPRTLRWLGRVGLPRIFDGEHSFVLEPLAKDRVRLIHAECFRGILVPFLWKGLDTDTRAGFEQMNQALKERAEKSEPLTRVE